LFGGKTFFRGSARLLSRPMDAYCRLFRSLGILWRADETGIMVCGTLMGGECCVSGDVSSQFLSGLLLALPHAPKDSTILLTSPLQSAPYAAMTEAMLATFGYTVGATKQFGRRYAVPGGQKGRYQRRLELPADESSAAYFGALNALCGSVTFENGARDALQADSVWRELFPQLASGAPKLCVADCPDLAPLLMALGALQHGVTLTDAGRLQYKESDRGGVMAHELRKCGVRVDISQGGDTITVSGGAKAPVLPLDAHNDHRIAMSLGVLLTRTGGTLQGAECVAKSYPAFWDVLRTLGIKAE